MKVKKLKSAVAVRGGPWRHAWHTRARWNAVRQRWECRVKPGLVNGVAPTVSLEREEWPREFLKSREQEQEQEQEREDVADVPIVYDPWMGLGSLRSVGTGVVSTEAPESVLEFFRKKGVKDALRIGNEEEVLGQLVNGQGSTVNGGRLLRACDVVLSVDRPATGTQWTTGAGVDVITAQFALTVNTKPNARAAGYLRTTSRWTAPVDRTDLIKGDVADAPVDEHLVATVFLLSPEKTPEDAPVDGAWTAFVQHGLFWNVGHAMSKPAALAEQQLTLNTGLAGGAGDAINNFILAQINDPLSAAAQFLAGGRLVSTLWTV